MSQDPYKLLSHLRVYQAILAIQLIHGKFNLLLAFSIDQVIYSFGLHEIQLTIEESSLGELSRLCFSEAWDLTNCFKHLLLDGVASVDLKLDHVFACVRFWLFEKQKNTGVYSL